MERFICIHGHFYQPPRRLESKRGRPKGWKIEHSTGISDLIRLVSLNEIGGDPGQFGTNVETFHEHNLARAERWPHSLLATATHDTKRGEAVRARINVLSEMPAEWKAASWNISRRRNCRHACLAKVRRPEIKLFLIRHTLQFRNSHRDLFDRGKYVPIRDHGLKHQRVCAFARVLPQREAALVAVPRLVFTLMAGTEEMSIGRKVGESTWLEVPSELGQGEWRNVLTRETVATSGLRESCGLALADLFAVCPLARMEARLIAQRGPKRRLAQLPQWLDSIWPPAP